MNRKETQVGRKNTKNKTLYASGRLKEKLSFEKNNFDAQVHQNNPRFSILPNISNNIVYRKSFGICSLKKKKKITFKE